MTTAALTRDPFMPRRPRGMRLSLALALLAHALLIVGLAFSVDWHTTEPNAVEAELWSAVPRQAAPREVAPPPRQEVRAAAAPPSPAAKPQPVQPPQVDPQIAIEKAKKVEAQRDQADQEQARRDKARQDQQARQSQLAKEDQARKKTLAAQADKAEVETEKADREKADKAKAEKAKAEKAKAEKAKAEKAVAAALQAAARAAQIKRMQGLAGASGESTSTGSAARSSGPSSSYAGRIMARIKPNIVFSDSVDGNPSATVEVKVAPDGTITGRRLVQSSGAKAWDEAVLRAIDRTDGLPRDIDGRVQPLMLITFKRE